MITEPMFISARTFRDYDMYRLDCARAEGWNDAMRFIFGEEIEAKRVQYMRGSL